MSDHVTSLLKTTLLLPTASELKAKLPSGVYKASLLNYLSRLVLFKRKTHVILNLLEAAVKS